jgi:multidrug efflux pump subunit AcrB
MNSSNGPILIVEDVPNVLELLEVTLRFKGYAVITARNGEEALEVMEALSAAELPPGYGYEWTSIAYQEKQAGGTQGPIFGMAMVFVFLVLAAQYESWAVPFSVLLGLPIGVFGAFLGVSYAVQEQRASRSESWR